MAGRSRERFEACLGAAAAIVACAALAHVAAGGRIADIATLGLLTAAALVLTVALASMRWTFARLLVLTAAAQPVLHVVLGATASHGSPSHGAHAMHHTGEQHAAMLASSSHADAAMWVVHVVAAVVTAVVVRWGWRWLRSMPALLRAIVYATRSARRPLAVSRTRHVDFEERVVCRLTMLPWDERGPPLLV